MPDVVFEWLELDREVPVAVDYFAIQLDLGILAHVADHVPVDHALIDAAGLRIAGAHGHVEAAADLFIEEDIAGEAVDLDNWCRWQIRLNIAPRDRCPACSPGNPGLFWLMLSQLCRPQSQFDTFYCSALVDGRVGEAHPAIDRMFHRPSENLAIR